MFRGISFFLRCSNKSPPARAPTTNMHGSRLPSCPLRCMLATPWNFFALAGPDLARLAVGPRQKQTGPPARHCSSPLLFLGMLAVMTDAYSDLPNQPHLCPLLRLSRPSSPCRRRPSLRGQNSRVPNPSVQAGRRHHHYHVAVTTQKHRGLCFARPRDSSCYCSPEMTPMETRPSRIRPQVPTVVVWWLERWRRTKAAVQPVQGLCFFCKRA